MYNEEVTLITPKYIEDEYGQQVQAPDSEITLLCKTRSIGRQEYYMAGQNGLKPEVIIVIKGYEYDNQQELIYKNKRYYVERTYSTEFEEIELTCVAGVKDV